MMTGPSMPGDRGTALAEQVTQHAALHVDHVGAPLFQVLVFDACKVGCDRRHVAPEGKRRVLALVADPGDDVLQQLRVLHHEQVRIVDRRLLIAELGGDAVVHALQVTARGRKGVAQTSNLGIHLLRLDPMVLDRELLGFEAVDRSDADAWRGCNALEGHGSPPKLPSTSSFNACSACSSSGPLARTLITLALFGGQHHDAHDALAVHLEIFARYEYFGLVLSRRFHEQRTSTRVQAELIANLELNFHQQCILTLRTDVYGSRWRRGSECRVPAPTPWGSVGHVAQRSGPA